MTTSCTICTRDQADTAYACPGCTDRAYRDLVDLADAVPAARDVAAGLAHRGAAVRGSGTGSRLPLDLSALARLDDVSARITTWARAVADRGYRDQVPAAGDPLEASARYLAARLEWLRHQQFADEAYRDFAAAKRVVHGIAIGPGERRWLGQCGEGDPVCEAEVYARVGARTATCHGCGTRHDVAQRRRWLDQVAREYAYTPREIELAYGIRAGTIRVWAHRELLAADKHGRYPLGEVLDVAASEAARRAEAQAKRAARRAGQDDTTDPEGCAA